MESRWSPKLVPCLRAAGGLAFRSRYYTFCTTPKFGENQVTMRIDPGQKIAGMRAIDVRDLMRKIHDAFRADWLDDQGFSARTRNAIIRELLALGYIEPEMNRHYDRSPFPWYAVTDLGRSFRQGLAARPVNRAHAEKVLREFMERVIVANQRDDFLVRVTDVVLYGSFLRDASTLGDVDLAVRFERKFDPQDSQKVVIEHFRKSGRAWTGICCEYSWAFDEVWQFLKSRKRTLSLHQMDDFLGMEKDERFSYEVLLGDPAKIARDLQAAEETRRSRPESSTR
jgi:hypothetical protein